jgi:hypothetical protein
MERKMVQTEEKSREERRKLVSREGEWDWKANRRSASV